MNSCRKKVNLLNSLLEEYRLSKTRKNENSFYDVFQTYDQKEMREYDWMTGTPTIEDDFEGFAKIYDEL